MIKKFLFVLALGIISITNISWDSEKNSKSVKTETFHNYSFQLYQELKTPELKYDVFEMALKGFFKLHQNKSLKNSHVLSIIDMRKSSNAERLFVIDLKKKQVIYKSVVAHGRNSGLEYAKNFSNQVNSYKTSLGFYTTAETYIGKHGLSLRLDGLEVSNNNARKRAIVIHSADYVSDQFIKNNGRLGRSLGCPSLPKKDYKQIIQQIKEESVLFIYHPDKEYLKSSELANTSIENLSNLDALPFLN